MKKRCLVWMLLLALLLPMLGMEASAEKVTESTQRHYGIAFYSNGVCSICGKIGTCGDDLTWNFDDKTGTLSFGPWRITSPTVWATAPLPRMLPAPAVRSSPSCLERWHNASIPCLRAGDFCPGTGELWQGNACTYALFLV